MHSDTQKLTGSSVHGEVPRSCILMGLYNMETTLSHNHFKDTSIGPFYFPSKNSLLQNCFDAIEAIYFYFNVSLRTQEF